MATLVMQPIGPTPAPDSQGHQRSEKSSGGDGADLGDIDSGWVVLENSDIVPADLAAAAAASSPTIPTCLFHVHFISPLRARRVLGGVVFTVVPFYKRIMHMEDATVGTVENVVEVVEHVAEVTEKIAANMADQLPQDGSLQEIAEKIEHIAEVVNNDAEKVEAVVEKIDTVSDEIDAAVEPVIDELEKQLDQTFSTLDNGANTQD